MHEVQQVSLGAEWEAFLLVISFIWGACFGSFLNVCIYRIPRDLSVVKPRSFCPHCNKMIPWYYNIPVFSFLYLQGKCGFCEVKITPRYFLVELLVAVLFTLVWLKFDFMGRDRLLGLVPVTDISLVPIFWLMISGLVVGTFVDFEHLIIPDRVTLGGIAAGLILSALAPALHSVDDWKISLMLSCIGAVTGWGILWLIAVFGKMLFKKDAMGFGDVKLLSAIGAFLGWRAVCFTLFMSSLAGSVVGITFVLCKSKEMSSKIPFGPYLALAALLWILWGPALWQAYMDFMLPPEPSYLP